MGGVKKVSKTKEFGDFVSACAGTPYVKPYIVVNVFHYESVSVAVAKGLVKNLLKAIKYLEDNEVKKASKPKGANHVNR